ncbi:hypothetical protein [Bacillus mycoides]|nr:hypothetical protein [Bacillus mycoides]
MKRSDPFLVPCGVKPEGCSEWENRLYDRSRGLYVWKSEYIN